MAELQFSNPLSEPVGGAHIKVIGIGGGGCNAGYASILGIMFIFAIQKFSSLKRGL